MNSAFMHFQYMGRFVASDGVTFELWECGVCFSLVRHAAVQAHFSAHNIA